MRVLHLASFIGNIGDNASHLGLASILGGMLPPHEVTRIEMRRFYTHYSGADRLRFDADFLAYANSFDLFLIGGGAFLNPSIEGSRSGTTIDLDPAGVRELRVPTVLTSIGRKHTPPVPTGVESNFARFLEALYSNDRIRVLTRNDGTKAMIDRELGSGFTDPMREVLDSAFFYSPTSSADLGETGYVAVNVATDQLALEPHRTTLTEADHFAELRAMVQLLAGDGHRVVFVPHVLADLGAIHEVAGNLDDFAMRSMVSVAPCLQGDAGADRVLAVYRDAAAVIGTRFHANVCPMAISVPTVGCAVLGRITDLYASLGIAEDCVDATEGFGTRLAARVQLHLATPLAAGRQQRLDELRRATLDTYRSTFAELL